MSCGMTQLEHSAIAYAALPCLAVDFCPSLYVIVALLYYAGIRNGTKVGNETMTE